MGGGVFSRDDFTGLVCALRHTPAVCTSQAWPQSQSRPYVRYRTDTRVISS